MKILLRALFPVTLILAAYSAVYPCECQIMSAGKRFHKAKTVFIGEVVEIGQSGKGEGLSVYVRLRVETYWKGVKSDQVTVLGYPASAGACGLPVKVGDRYLIYAFKAGDDLISSFCESRTLDNAAEDIARLGSGKKYKGSSH